MAQQLYAGWFAVPQISMPLADLDLPQMTALRGLLRLWRDNADTILDGTLHTRGAERGYDQVEALRPDLGRAVIVRYADLATEVTEEVDDRLLLINATPANRVVLRTTLPIIGGIVRTSSAVILNAIAAHPPGFIELTVPPFGSAELSFTRN